MKKVLLCLLCFAMVAADAQTDTTVEWKALNKREIKLRLYTISNEFQNGILVNLTDTTLSLASRNIENNKTSVNQNLILPYQQINTVSYHRKGAGGRTGLAVGGICFGVGVIIGLAEGDDPKGSWFSMSAGEKGLAYGLLMAIPGTVVGLITGSLLNKRFTIAGNKNNFQQFKKFVFDKNRRVMQANF